MTGFPDITLVIASCVVAAAAAYAALDLGARACLFEGRHRIAWLAAAALSLITGAWAAMIVSLKGLPGTMALTFDLGVTLLAGVLAGTIAFAGLRLVTAQRLTRSVVLASGALLSVSIIVIEIGSLFALRLAPPAGVPVMALVLSSILMLVFATSALSLAFRVHALPLRHALARRILAALVLGFGLAGSIVAGVEALVIAPGAQPASGNLLEIDWMGQSVALLTCVLLGTAIGLSMLDARMLLARRHLARARTKAERLHRLNHYDSATGLPNRELLINTLINALVQAHNTHEDAAPIGLVYAELENHAALVKRLGEARLNRILGRLAVQLRRRLGADDLLARPAPGAFSLMIRERDARTTAAALSLLSAQLSTPVEDGGNAFRFGWAIGSARYPDDGDSAHGLLRAAMHAHHHIGTDAMPRAASATPRYQPES